MNAIVKFQMCHPCSKIDLPPGALNKKEHVRYTTQLGIGLCQHDGIPIHLKREYQTETLVVCPVMANTFI